MSSEQKNAVTPCECTQAGWCPRHQCEKTEHWVHLCQTRPDYFELYEQGLGPGQLKPQEPGLIRKAFTFGRAVVRHVVNRGREASEELYQARLAVCKDCEFLDQERRVCQDPRCGCFVDRKARWESENCPQGKWPPVSSFEEKPDPPTDADRFHV
jgi:hypothetical protein